MRTRVQLLLIASVTAIADVQAQPDVTSRLHWVTNGQVTAAATLDHRLFIGGTFTRIAPAADALGSAYRLSLATGADLSGLPLVDGEVRDIEPDGAGGYYLAGHFSRVGGLARTNLAHVLADGTTDPAFVVTWGHGVFPSGGLVSSVALTPTALFVAGPFDTVNGESRPGLAALAPATGATLPWVSTALDRLSPVFTQDPQAALLVHADDLIAVGPTFEGLAAMVLDQSTGTVIRKVVVGSSAGGPVTVLPIDGTLIVGGRFQRADDPLASSLARIDRASWTIDVSWKPMLSDDAFRPRVITLAAVGTTLYFGGQFSGVSGHPRSNLAAVDVASGVLTPWAPETDGDVFALIPSPGGLLVGGDFLQIGGARRERIAEVTTAGAVTAWQAGVFPMVVRTLDSAASAVAVGGRMAVRGGLARTNLAGFDLDTDSALPWAPAATLPVVNLLAGGEFVYIGQERPVPNAANEGVVTAVRADDGRPTSWHVPDFAVPGSGVFLSAIDAAGVYVRSLFGGGRRADPITGVLDPGWLGVTGPVLDHGRIFGVAGSDTLVMSDAATGARGWTIGPPVGYPEPTPIVIGDLTTDGDSVLAIGRGAFDAQSALPVSWPLGLFVGPVSSVATADGLRFATTRGDPFNSVPPPLGRGAIGRRSDGTDAWVPGVTAIPYFKAFAPVPRVYTRASDVIVVGVEGTVPSIVHGVAVYRRRPASAPSGLRWRSVGNTVSFDWTPPAAAPPAYVLEAGSAPGQADLAQVLLPATPSFTAVAPSGTFFVRVRSAEAAGSAGVATNEVAVVVGCSGPPPPPTTLTATVQSAQVSLAWRAPPFQVPTGYVLEAGSASGLRDIVTLTLGPEQTSLDASAPPGTYFVRVRAVNACGQGAATPDVFVSVGAPSNLPPAPAAPSAVVQGTGVSLTWPPVVGATAYRLEAGSAPLESDLLTVTTGRPAVTAPDVAFGTYYVRVRAVSAAGLGPPSADVVVVVP